MQNFHDSKQCCKVKISLTADNAPSVERQLFNYEEEETEDNTHMYYAAVSHTVKDRSFILRIV